MSLLLATLQAKSKKRREELSMTFQRAANLTWCGSERVYQRMEDLKGNASDRKQRNAIARLELFLLKTGGL